MPAPWLGVTVVDLSRALSGPVGGPPTPSGVPITDILSGMFGAYGVVAALHERDQTGRGQRVTTSLLASAVAIHGFQGARWTLAGEVAEPLGNRHATIAPYGAYICSDGWINIAVGAESQWRNFAELVGIDPDDPRYATNRERRQNVDEADRPSAPPHRGRYRTAGSAGPVVTFGPTCTAAPALPRRTQRRGPRPP